jgi:hypothetical protein
MFILNQILGGCLSDLKRRRGVIMAKCTVEYFPFIIKDGRTLFMLKEKYGLAGIGFFTELFRFLAGIPYHYYSIENDYDKKRLIKYIDIEESKVMEMLTVLTETGKIDKTLFTKYKIIASQDFFDSLEPLYSRRQNMLYSVEHLMELARDNIEVPDNMLQDVPVNTTDCIHTVIDENTVCNSENNGMRLKERKEKERKGDKTSSPLLIDNNNSEENPHMIAIEFQKFYNKKTAQLRKPSDENYLKAYKYCESSLNIKQSIKKAIEAIPYYFSEKWWHTTRNRKCEEIDSSLWCFGGFIAHVGEIIAWINKPEIKEARASPKICKNCGKEYGYSTEKDICLECLEKIVEEERTRE